MGSKIIKELKKLNREKADLDRRIGELVKLKALQDYYCGYITELPDKYVKFYEDFKITEDKKPINLKDIRRDELLDDECIKESLITDDQDRAISRYMSSINYSWIGETYYKRSYKIFNKYGKVSEKLEYSYNKGYYTDSCTHRDDYDVKVLLRFDNELKKAYLHLGFYRDREYYYTDIGKNLKFGGEVHSFEDVKKIAENTNILNEQILEIWDAIQYTKNILNWGK